jgi:hypothetical protein
LFHLACPPGFAADADFAYMMGSGKAGFNWDMGRMSKLPGDAEGKAGRLRAAAERARAEAEARRKALRGENRPKEIGGPDGPEPTRYGDWEKGGITSDF